MQTKTKKAPRTIKMKRTIRRNLRRFNNGIKAFSQVPHYQFIQNIKEVSCTTARNFIRDKGIKPPAIISVVRQSRKEDKFFFANSGLYELEYAALNWRDFMKEFANSGN
jgi:hypothetical protein